MPRLKLKFNHKAVTTHYAEINNLAKSASLVRARSRPFSGLLRVCSPQFHWTLAEQYTIKRDGRMLRLDSALINAFNLVYGY